MSGFVIIGRKNKDGAFLMSKDPNCRAHERPSQARRDANLWNYGNESGIDDMCICDQKSSEEIAREERYKKGDYNPWG